MTKPVLQFEWSVTNKHVEVSIDGKIAKSGNEWSSILIEPRLSFADTKTMQIRVISSYVINFFLYISTSF